MKFPAFSLLLACLPVASFASKLVEVRPVDDETLMVYFKDGEVFYTDDGKRASAFTGHDYADGDDKLVSYGEPLDVKVAAMPTAWSLATGDGAGAAPTGVGRKAKVNNTNNDWQYRLDHWVFLKLPARLEPGRTYTLRVDPKTQTDRPSVTFTYEPERVQSEAVHVNLLGYTPSSPVKAADLYLWLGDAGPRDYTKFEGNLVWLVDTVTGKRHEVGKVTFGHKAGPDVGDFNLTGSPVWHADFSSFNTPGNYRLVIDRVGASAPFDIRPDVWRKPFQTSVLGYYYMRIGEPKDARVPAPRQPRFLPGEDPKGFTVYITDLDPFDAAWQQVPPDQWDEPHFKPASQSVFMKHRLPGNPTNPNAKGGHSDALDWDRHLGHVSDAWDLLLPYVLSRGALSDDATGIRESGNGIPDLIDEARNEVDMFLSLRDPDGGYGQGLTNPTTERTIMFQAGSNAIAAWANAANAAMLAEAFRVAGNTTLMEHYRDAAFEAYAVAERQKDQLLDTKQEIGDAWMRGRDFKQMAAAYLYNVTGDTKWEEIFAAESNAKEKPVWIEDYKNSVQTYASVAYLFTPREQHHPELAKNLRASFAKQAKENNLVWTDKRPSRRSTNNNIWQPPHNLQVVCIAHALETDATMRETLLRAMVLEADWGLGRNPTNTVEMTGLGSRHIVNCYTSGRNDGTPGLHPGHTPYNNIHPWGTNPNGHNPRWFSDRGYPDWDKGGWPYQEAHFNCRYSWANGEFTPRQTMRGKMVLYGYLEFLTLAGVAPAGSAR
ncbi:glycoside hydrolase family 9 protein [Nibricoccus sp. IMCC34717]|uniref:glycoside hydrolase family 9 protein n=1 Tax=Nibricoccus sp. IMCC34717 TaxID=3034021 RepID=UPI003850A42C